MSETQRSELSDEDQDIDIESDDDDTNSSTGGPYETADKKAHHNALERKRRDHIKESFMGLRDCLPGVKREKPSRAQILKQATDYIQHMMKKTSVCQSDIENMRKQNQLLRQQVKIAERKRKMESLNGESGQSSYYMGGHEQSDSSDNNSDHDLKIKPRVYQTKGGHKRTKTN